jgi:hypothetical protein
MSSRQVVPLIAALVLSAVRASASEPAEVEVLIQEANQLRREGKDGMALPLMRRAYDMATTARTAAQLGLVEVALGYWLPAEQHLVEALSSPRDPWIHQNRAELERVLAGIRASIGEIEVVGQPPGSEVVVNGQSVGILPLAKPVRVGDGPVRVEVRADGYRPSIQTLTMSKGAKQQVDVRLARVTGALASLPIAEPTADIADQATGPANGRGRTGSRTAAWVTAGAATAAVGVGVVASLTWASKRDEFDNHTVPVLDNAGVATIRRRKDCGVQNDNRGGEDCARLYDQVNRAKTIAVVGYVSGGLLAAGAATLFLLAPSPEAPRAHAGVTCAPTLVAVGGICRLAF